MEKDIVERLRDATLDDGSVGLCREAADEIEQLREFLKTVSLKMIDGPPAVHDSYELQLAEADKP